MFTRAWEADIVMESFQFAPGAGGESNQQAREIMSRTMIIIPVDFHPSFSRLLRWIPTPEFQEKQLAHGEGAEN
jgi:hypothetical protein